MTALTVTADVDIVNLTLGRIGEDTIVDLNQEGKVARVMRTAFVPSRNSLLRHPRWRFALTRASLAPTTYAGSTSLFGFTYAFNLPDDCLAFIGVFDQNEDVRNYTATKMPFKIEGRQLLFDESDPLIYYTRIVEDVRLMDPLFVDALAWKLGIDTAFGIATGPDMVKTCATMFKDVLRTAKIANAIEDTPEVLTTSEWLDARNYGGWSGRPGPIAF